MNKSDYLVGFLDSKTQRAYAESQDVQAPADKPKPATPQLALLRRIKKVVFSPATKTLEQALEKFETIVDSLDDSEDDDAPKPNDTPKE
jgi:hypothetical protein